MRIVRQELGKKVGLINPHPRISQALLRCRPDFVKQIRAEALAASQLPTAIHDTKITQPAHW